MRAKSGVVQNRVSPNAPDRRAGGIPATKRALAIAAVEGGRKCVSWPFEARGRRRTDAACRLLLDSRRGNDLFCRISVGGRLPRFSIPSPDRAAVVRVRVSNLVHLSSALDLSMRYWILT